MPFSSLRVLHTIADINLTGGGPPQAVASICAAQAALGANVHIVSQTKHSAGDNESLFHPQDVEIHLTRLTLDSQRWRLKYSLFFGRRVKSLCRQKNMQVIHDHGLWLPSNHSAARVACLLGVPLVIQPHGMLAPWALEHRAWKKRLVWALYRRSDFEIASLFVATSDQEADSIRKMGLRKPIAIIPIGIDLPAFKEPIHRDMKTHLALFLSRIHPVKGLLNLVAAWDQVRPKGWKMIIAGPDEENHRVQVERAVKSAKLEQDFEFVGPAAGIAKETLYREADLFILPSYSENFGIVIAEALSYGVPVITTHGTPWQTLLTHGCGWWVQPTAESIAEALREATSLSDAARHEMGKRGRSFVENQFSCPRVGSDMIHAYHWVLGVGAKPSFIID